MVHPQEIPETHPDIGNRMGYPPEPSIKNYEIWLDWQAHQLDTPQWWAGLTAISKVEGPRRLSQNICPSFLIPAVRCKALPGQDYIMPPAPKCLTRGRFLPDDPSYQDIQWQPLLLTVAYAWVLQYWTEKCRPPILNDYHPLVMSMVELRQHVRGYITFNKQDVFWNLGSTSPEVLSWDMGIPPGDPITMPPTANVGDLESSSTEAWGHITPSFHHWDVYLRRRPHQLSPPPSLLRLMSRALCLALQKLHWEEMSQSFQLNLMSRPQRTCWLVGPLAQPRWKLKLSPPPDCWLTWPASSTHPTRPRKKDSLCWL